MWQAILLSISPISELRGGIPVGVALGYHPLLVLLVAVTFNTLVYFPLRLLLNTTGSKLPLPFLNSARKRCKPFVDKYGKCGLAVFVGIPLPYSGVYTATIASWALGFSTRSALIPITAGVLIAGIIVTLLTISVGEIL